MEQGRGFTADLWRSIDSIYADILDHPFLAGLTDGTLPEECFRHYVLQDTVYLREDALAPLAPRVVYCVVPQQLLIIEVLRRSLEPGQYTALSFGKKLEEGGIVPSMSRVGSALDNAISESFVSTLKCEIGTSRYPTRQAARTSVFEYTELFYNRERRHSSLEYVSPFEYEQAILEEAAVA